MTRPILAVVSACVFWGLSFLFAKVALEELGFAHVVLYRFVLASMLLGLVLARTRTLPLGRDVPRLVLTGFICVPASMLLQFAGLERTSVTSASFIIGAAPPILALSAHILYRERLGRVGWGAIGLSSIGVGIMVGMPGGGHDWLGDAMVLGSIVLAAAWMLMSRPFTRAYGALAATAFILMTGTALLIPIVLIWAGPPTLAVSATTWASLSTLTVFCTVVAFVLWNWGVDRMDAGRAGVFINLEPVVGAASGIALLGDTMTAGTIAGGLLILAAAGIVTRPARVAR